MTLDFTPERAAKVSQKVGATTGIVAQGLCSILLATVAQTVSASKMVYTNLKAEYTTTKQ